MKFDIVLLAGLLVGVSLPLFAHYDLGSCAGHMQVADPKQLCFDHFLAHGLHVQAESEALVAELVARGGRTCVAPSKLPKGTVPTWVVMRRTNGTVIGETFDKAWADARAGRAWTVTVCP